MNCLLCRLPLKINVGVCHACYLLLPFMKEICNCCGLTNFNKNRCFNCDTFNPNWDYLIAVTEYENPLKNLINDYKSNNKTQYTDAIARLMFITWFYKRNILAIKKPDLIICIPSSKKKLLSRGYNQADLLAHKIAQFMQCDYKPYLLKTNNKLEQKRLSKKERELNTQNKYLINDKKIKLDNLTIAIIDDIVTTGHTINEASKILKHHGAKEIQIICLCRTIL